MSLDSRRTRHHGYANRATTVTTITPTTSADRYLASSHHRRPDPEDAARFHAWKTCLGILGIPFLDVVRVLGAVLLLGNVQFAESAEGAAEPAGEAELAAAAALLGVPAPALLRGLSTRSSARGARPTAGARAPASAAAATAARDALAKALYCRTVATIVRRANSLKRLGSTLGTLSSDSNESVHNQDAASRRASTAGGRSRAGAKSMAVLNDAVRHATDGFVGILDMFGFEDAAPSRLEHLCANLCAETMQHFYNTHVFKSSAESCREEGVACPLEVCIYVRTAFAVMVAMFTIGRRSCRRWTTWTTCRALTWCRRCAAGCWPR